jgi:hypothetical protein
MKKSKKPKLTQWSEDELLRRACIHAESDLETWLDAIRESTDPEYVEMRQEQTALLKQLKAYRRRRWGRTKLEEVMQQLHGCSLQNLLKRTAQRTARPKKARS